MRGCPSRFRPGPWAAFALLAFASGCYPGLAWLPDSGAFVYAGGKGGKQLLQYDLKAKASRVIVADVGGPCWPAVSPDGKRIAVVTVRHEPEADRGGYLAVLTVAVFDAGGKRVHRSKPLPWNHDGWIKDSAPNPLPWAAWDPRGDRLVICRRGRTALYDLKTEKVTEVPGALLPVEGWPAMPHGGKGFLTLTNRRVFLVGWDGKARRATAITPPSDRKEGPWATDLYHYFPCPLEGSVVTCGLFAESEDKLDHVLRIDLGKHTAKVEKSKGWPSQRTHTFPGGVTVRAVPLERGSGSRLEAVRPGARAAEALPERLPEAAVFLPSPDRKWLAIGWINGTVGYTARFPPRPAERHLFILDAGGKLYARLDGDK